MSVEYYLRRARDAINCPNMHSDLKDYISNCSMCRTESYSQQKPSLKFHYTPDRHWHKVTTDVFSYKEKNDIILVDYYSVFLVIALLPNSEYITVDVVHILKAHFTRYGIPDILTSDNGQYTVCSISV